MKIANWVTSFQLQEADCIIIVVSDFFSLENKAQLNFLCYILRNHK